MYGLQEVDSQNIWVSLIGFYVFTKKMRTQNWIYDLEGTFGKSWVRGEYNQNRVYDIFKREKIDVILVTNSGMPQ